MTGFILSNPAERDAQIMLIECCTQTKRHFSLRFSANGVQPWVNLYLCFTLYVNDLSSSDFACKQYILEFCNRLIKNMPTTCLSVDEWVQWKPLSVLLLFAILRVLGIELDWQIWEVKEIVQFWCNISKTLYYYYMNSSPQKWINHTPSIPNRIISSMVHKSRCLTKISSSFFSPFNQNR